MVARDTDESHRASTPLELLFDLCFVVGVAQASGRLHHALTDGEIGHGIGRYLMVFFAIWWAWVNFTWFASAYDNDDVPYRLTTLVQITGALILAAGIPAAFDRQRLHGRRHRLRRDAAGDGRAVAAGGAGRTRSTGSPRCGSRSASRSCRSAGSPGCALPDSLGLAGFLVLVLAELLVPIWAEHAAGTTWHPMHIAERYGLFTLIVLGEAMLASTTAIQTAFDAGGDRVALLGLTAAGLVDRVRDVVALLRSPTLNRC